MWEAGTIVVGRFEEREGAKSFWRIGKGNRTGCMGIVSAHLRIVTMTWKWDQSMLFSCLLAGLRWAVIIKAVNQNLQSNFRVKKKVIQLD